MRSGITHLDLMLETCDVSGGLEMLAGGQGDEEGGGGGWRAERKI